MKKLICLLGLFMILAQVAYAGFSDVSSVDSNFSAIDYVKSQGIVEGYEDGTYQPGKKINRAEFTKILIAAKFSAEEIDSCVATKKFSDVPDGEWFAKYVCVARNSEIINGYEDGTFKPNNEINFAEASKIVVKTYELEFIPTEDSEHWYLPYVEALYLQAAVPLTVVDYGKSISRGEMAEVIFGVETDQGYVAGDDDEDDEEDGEDGEDGDDDVADDDEEDDDEEDDDVAGDDDVDDDSGEVYSAAQIREFINDCSKIMIQPGDLPAGYSIDSFEVYRGGTSADKFADCYQYINFPGMKSDQFPTTIHYLIAESEEVTHQQMEIMRSEMPDWGWEDQCQSYIGGKLSYYIEGGKGFFIDGSITTVEDEMNKKLYDKAWDLKAYYENVNNGSNCIGGREDSPEFNDQADENCLFLAEDIATGEFDGEVFFDNNGVLRENNCYWEVPESLVKSRLSIFGDADKAWQFFHDDYERKRLVFKTSLDDGFIYKDDAVHGIIEQYDSQAN